MTFCSPWSTGWKGFPDAITAVFPRTIVQTCIVHLDQEQSELRVLAGSQTAGAGAAGDLPGRGTASRSPSCGLPTSRPSGAKKYPAIAPAWRRSFGTRSCRSSPIPPQIRKMIYTTNAIEEPCTVACARSSKPEEHSRQNRKPPPNCSAPGAEQSWRSLEACHRVASRLRAVHHLLCRRRLPTTLR